MNESIIATTNLTKFYGKSRGISSLNLEIKHGEIFGFLGPNGAGKTTTIRLLLDLIRPSSGRASIFGLDSRRDSIAIRRRVGYLPGEYSLYEHLSGRDLVKYFSELRGGADGRFLEELSERLGSDLLRPLGALSHGNKQKIGLIQALMNRPELLILDEPTVGLDPLVQQEFYSILGEAREGGGTVFLSSHILPEVQRICDRIGFVRNGELIAVEDVSAIKEKSIRKVEVTFDKAVPREALEHLPVHDLIVDGRHFRCSVQGSVDPLIKALARYRVMDLISHEPSLEEIFLALYGEGSHSEQHITKDNP